MPSRPRFAENHAPPGSVVVVKKCSACSRTFSAPMLPGFERFQKLCGNCRRATVLPTYRLVIRDGARPMACSAHVGLTDMGDVERAQFAKLSQGAEVSAGDFGGFGWPVRRKCNAIKAGEIDLLLADNATESVNLGDEGAFATRIVNRRHIRAEESLELRRSSRSR